MTADYQAFNEQNNRIFYACQAVLVNRKDGAETKTFGRNTQDESLTDLATNNYYLHGVQSVGVSQSVPSVSLLDVGRFQRKFHYWEKPQFEITIERVIGSRDGSGFFYQVDSSDYVASAAGYKSTHILYEDNIGVSGAENDNGKSLKNYDITLIYARDKFKRFMSSKGVDQDTTAGSPGVQEDPDADRLQAITYRGCLLTNISYSMGVGAKITESITLVTRLATRETDVTISDYDNLPDRWLAANSPVETKGYGKADLDNVLIWNDISLLGLPGTDAPGNNDSILPKEVLTAFDIKDFVGEDRARKSNVPILGIQSIDIDVTIDYAEMEDVGMWRGASQTITKPEEKGYLNQFRYINLPVQVTASFTGVTRRNYATPDTMYFQDGSTRGFPVSDTLFSKARGRADTDTTTKEGDSYRLARYGNEIGGLLDRDGQIRIAAKKRKFLYNTESEPPLDYYFVWDLGKANYLTDISTTGGDTGGGNVQTTMSYQNDGSDILLARDTSIKNIPYPTTPR